MALYKHIAVAIDFSQQSIIALEKALTFKKQYEAKLTLIAVVDTKSFGSVEAYDVKYAKKLVADYEQQLQQLKEKYEGEYGIIETRVEKGSPKEILTTLSDVDLLVCGATGKSKAEKFVLGSISSVILRHAKSDVFIVRP